MNSIIYNNNHEVFKNYIYLWYLSYISCKLDMDLLCQVGLTFAQEFDVQDEDPDVILEKLQFIR